MKPSWPRTILYEWPPTCLALSGQVGVPLEHTARHQSATYVFVHVQMHSIYLVMNVNYDALVVAIVCCLLLLDAIVKRFGLIFRGGLRQVFIIIIIIIIMFRLCHLAVPQPEPHRVASTCSVSTKSNNNANGDNLQSSCRVLQSAERQKHRECMYSDTKIVINLT